MKILLWRHWTRFALAGSLALPLSFPVCGAAGTEPVLPDSPAPALIALEQQPATAKTAAPAAPVAAHGYTLAECIHIALDQQPAMNAQRASLAAAEAGRRALENLRVPTFIARDLPIRRNQAAIGVGIASAALEQTERETVYAVTRLYFSVLYAREQQKVAKAVVDHLGATRDIADAALKGASREVSTNTVDKINVYLRLAEVKRIDADEGVDRALAALREAMGLACDVPLTITGDMLPDPTIIVNREEILALAATQRAEIVQVQGVSEVTCLEVKAQGVKHGVKVDTFAAGSDIHSRPVPQGISNHEYRPGAIGPEMPDLLVGSKCDRQERARDFYARSVAVVDKTRGLIALEAEDAFLKWREASRKVAIYQEAYTKGRNLADVTRKDYSSNLGKTEDVLTNEIIASQAQGSYNEARYHLILALAALERVTGGGFCAGLAKD